MLVLDQLLGNRRPSLGQLALCHIFHDRPGDAAQIDAAVLKEAGILDGNDRALQKRGNPVEGDPVPSLGEKPPGERPVAIVDLDGAVAGREQRVGDVSFLRPARGSQAQEQEER